MSQEKSGFEGERIAKAIARAGVCSRRDAEAMILEGRVSVNGKKLTSPALNVTEADDIRIDGKPLPAAERTRLFRYYKPRGLVTTAKDPQGRPTVFASLPEGMPRVISIGRLDLNSEGLLLLTNDGELARRLELPSTGWIRRYRVRVHGEVDETQLKQLARGIEVEGVRYGAVQATLDRKQGDNVWLTMSLTEGKNREIRKICGHFGWPVSRLIRVAYGPFQLGSHLNPGDIEEVPAKVLREQLGEKKVHQVSGQLKLKGAPTERPAADREHAGKQRADRPRADKLRSDRRRGDKLRPDQPRTGKLRADRRHEDKARPDRPHSDEARPGRLHAGKTRSDRPHGEKARLGQRHSDEARSRRPHAEKARSDRPHSDEARPGPLHADKTRSDRPHGEKARLGQRHSDEARSRRPHAEKARSDRPHGEKARPDRPHSGKARPERPQGKKARPSQPRGEKPHAERRHKPRPKSGRHAH